MVPGQVSFGDWPLRLCAPRWVPVPSRPPDPLDSGSARSNSRSSSRATDFGMPPYWRSWKLLRARERGEFISYSEWETEADIERYTNSSAHKQIVSQTRSVKGASAVVKLYDLVN